RLAITPRSTADGLCTSRRYADVDFDGGAFDACASPEIAFELGTCCGCPRKNVAGPDCCGLPFVWRDRSKAFPTLNYFANKLFLFVSIKAYASIRVNCASN